MATVQIERDPTIRRLEDEINRVYSEIFRMPRYRYWQFGKELYCWTTEPMKEHFYAMIYRHVKTKKVWKLVKKVEFGRRKVAKARAFKWYEEAKERFREAHS